MHPFESLDVPSGMIGIHWFGQNSFAMKDPAGTILLIDPYFPHDRPADRFIYADPPLDESTLRTDFVLLTHDHGDHTCPETLSRIEGAFPEARFAGPSESIDRLAGMGVAPSRLTALGAGDEIRLNAAAVSATYSKPPRGAPEDGIDPPDVDHMGYVIRCDDGPGVYVTGDLINTFADHDELVEPVRRLAPDIGLITMHPTEGEFPYFEGAVSLAAKLGLAAAVPAHYDCFVERTFDPQEWAALFPPGGPRPIIIPYNTSIVYPRD